MMTSQDCFSEIVIEDKLLALFSNDMEMDEFVTSTITFLKQNFLASNIEIVFLKKNEVNPSAMALIDIGNWLNELHCASFSGNCRDLLPDQLPESIISPYKSSKKKVHRYCLPLWIDPRPIGMIVLDFPLSRSLTPGKIIFLKRLAKIIILKALQVESIELINARNLQHDSELKHISQDLHDTIGQSIGFIRLKMEQVRYDFPSRRYPEISHELDRIQEVTEDAYRQVRGLLAELHPNSSLDLTTALSSQGYLLAERAGLTFSVIETGKPYSLPPLVKRQLLFIFREALNNVEKHARACQVDLIIQWGESDCLISLRDNGIGFIPMLLPTPDHYGLVIMQERASDISAQFVLESSPGNGTMVTIIVPVA